MIPVSEPSTGLLPSGIHTATWEELVARFGWTPHRLALLAGPKAALDALRVAGCRRAYIDGSFVTAKDMPGDFDGCWEVEGVDLARLDPVLKTFTSLLLQRDFDLVGRHTDSIWKLSLQYYGRRRSGSMAANCSRPMRQRI